jgi:hypothetical protein
MASSLPTSAQLHAAMSTGATHYQGKTLMTYRRHFKLYAALGFQSVSDFSMERIHVSVLTLYLKQTASRRANAAALGQVRSAVVSYATRVRGMPPLTAAEESYLASCTSMQEKEVGIIKKPTRPTTRATLKKLYDGLAHTFPWDRRAEAVVLQCIIAHGCTTRPSEVMAVRKGLCPLRASQVTFHPATASLPHGAATLTLRDTKGLHLSGQRGTETAMAAGIGGPLCPVAALHAVYSRYGLHDRPDEPVFAITNVDGTRRWTDTAHWTGAAPMTPRAINALLKVLCPAAGVPTFTARSTRNGSVVDMATAGVSPMVIMPAGRWKSPASVTPYTSMTAEGAAHIARAFAAPAGQ